MPGLTRAFSHKNYRLFIGGQLISLTGTWMQSVAQAWLVYRLTRSSSLLGLVSFVGQVPVFVLATFGGALADRAHRHHIVIATQTAAMMLAFVLAALTLSGQVHVWHIFALGALLGIVSAFDIPARQAFLVDMVGRTDLMNAIALNSSMVNGARVIGPAVAGAMVAAVGEGWCFLLNGVSYLAVIGGLMLMDRTRIPRSAPARGPVLTEIADGFRFVARTAPVRALLLLIGVVSMATPISVLMPIFADRDPARRCEGTGVLMGAFGLGAMVGALVPRRGTPFTGSTAGWRARRSASVARWSCSRSRAGSGRRWPCWSWRAR